MKNHQQPQTRVLTQKKPVLLDMAAMVITSAVLTVAVLVIAYAVDTKMKQINNPSTNGSILQGAKKVADKT